MHNPKVDWCFHTEKDETMNNRSIRYPRGKTLGGSSSINGLLWIRGQSNDYDNWRQMGNSGWGWNDVLPYFLKSENNELGKSEFHNDSGPIMVSNKKINQSVDGNTNTVYIDPLNSLRFVLGKLQKDKIKFNKNFYVFTGSSVGVVPILGKGIYFAKIDKIGSVSTKII